MNPNQRSYIVLGVMLLLLTILFSLIGRRNQARYSWYEHYRSGSNDPYGLSVLYGLMPDYFSGQPFTEINTREELESTLKDTTSPSNYIFIGNQFRLDISGVDQLISYVEAGNQVFLSTNRLSFDLFDQLFPLECDEYAWPNYSSMPDSTTSLRIFHPDLGDTSAWEITFRYGDFVTEYPWSFISDQIFCGLEPDVSKLGSSWGDTPNFMRLKRGEGAFFFHSTPLALTNYYIKERKGVEYANQVFSHLVDGPIYWDNFSSLNAAYDPNNYNSNRTLQGEGPLSFILSQQALAWAWYLAIAGILLYLLFRAKRKQRVIPVLEPNRNTSLDFITNIGRLYFLRPNHKKLAVEKMRLFLAYVRDRYYLHGREKDQAFITTLSAKSGIEQEAIEEIITINKNIEGSQYLGENALMKFHQKLEYFYKHCK